MKAICYKRVQRINQNSIHCQSKTQSYIQQRAPIIRLVNSIAKSIIALVQNVKRCSFYVTAGLEDIEDKGLIRVESKSKLLKEKTISDALTVFGIYIDNTVKVGYW